jgi:hypothetical protein
MADTPEQGAAQTSFDEAVTGLTTAQEAFTSAETAYKADEGSEELKTAWETTQTGVTTAQTTHDEAKTLLDSFSKQGYWPEDWRDNYISTLKDSEGKELDDDAKGKMLKRLGRYASPQAALDAMVSAQNKISGGELTKPLGKDPSKEELAEYRELNNIPEDAKGYDLALGDGLVIGEEDKDLVANFTEVAHSGNFSQDQVSQALNWYYSNIESQTAEQYESDSKFRQESEESLREEMGPEFQANRNLMANYLDTAGDGIAEAITGARLPDGSLLANDPGVIRFFVDKAREANPAGALVPGSGTKQMDAINDEITELEKEMGTPEWFKDQKKQERYLALVSARDKVKKK